MTVEMQPIMKNIEIDDDTYAYLLTKTVDFGETPAAVLRRELKLPTKGNPRITVSAGSEKSPLHQVLESSEFTYAKGVVGKFLVLLRSVHDEHTAAFDKVLSIKGRGRLYFAKDADTLEKSGTHVNPKQIPGTLYWVITTTPTILKQEILERAMKEFGYSLADVKTATAAIAY
jgi:negative regulator of replication initiation